MTRPVRLLAEQSKRGRHGFAFGPPAFPPAPIPEAHRRARPPALPEVTEGQVIRHFHRLAKMNFSVDGGFYPLGSCTMKHNPRMNEEAARSIRNVHPLENAPALRRALQELDHALCRICGMDAFALAPAAGAQGELAGALVMRAHHRKRGDARRTVMLVPDSAHGTNPATAAMAGFTVRVVPTGEDGGVDVGALERLAGDDVAGMMLTYPNTLGLFDRRVEEVARIVHGRGGLLHCDGANLNALVGVARPGDLGFDLVQVNLHKTFSTPHGGGGPGAGPLGVRAALAPFLPLPVLEDAPGGARWVEDAAERPDSIGRLHAFGGNVGVLLRAWAYIRELGGAGLREAAEAAVLSANYIRTSLRGVLDAPYDRICAHEVCLSARNLKASRGVTAMDVAKGLIDLGFHPPTVYFPLLVEEALLIEPTETETKETLDRFVECLRWVAASSAEALREAPTTTAVSRPDETRAARTPVLRDER